MRSKIGLKLATGALALLMTPLLAFTQTPVNIQTGVELIPLETGTNRVMLKRGGVQVGSEEVRVDGMTLLRGVDYTLEAPTGVVYLTQLPKAGQTLAITYNYSPLTTPTSGAVGGANLAIGAENFSFLFGLGQVERRLDGSTRETNSYGMQSNADFAGIGTKSILLMGENGGSSQKRAHAWFESAETSFLGGKLRASYQDIDSDFQGLATLSQAGYSKSQILDFQRQRGIRRSGFAIDGAHLGGLRFDQNQQLFQDEQGRTFEAGIWKLYGNQWSFEEGAQNQNLGFSGLEAFSASDRKTLQIRPGVTQNWSKFTSNFFSEVHPLTYSNLQQESRLGLLETTQLGFGAQNWGWSGLQRVGLDWTLARQNYEATPWANGSLKADLTEVDGRTGEAQRERYAFQTAGLKANYESRSSDLGFRLDGQAQDLEGLLLQHLNGYDQMGGSFEWKLGGANELSYSTLSLQRKISPNMGLLPQTNLFLLNGNINDLSSPLTNTLLTDFNRTGFQTKWDGITLGFDYETASFAPSEQMPLGVDQSKKGTTLRVDQKASLLIDDANVDSGEGQKNTHLNTLSTSVAPHAGVSVGSLAATDEVPGATFGFWTQIGSSLFLDYGLNDTVLATDGLKFPSFDFAGAKRMETGYTLRTLQPVPLLGVQLAIGERNPLDRGLYSFDREFYGVSKNLGLFDLSYENQKLSRPGIGKAQETAWKFSTAQDTPFSASFTYKVHQESDSPEQQITKEVGLNWKPSSKLQISSEVSINPELPSTDKLLGSMTTESVQNRFQFNFQPNTITSLGVNWNTTADPNMEINSQAANFYLNLLGAKLAYGLEDTDALGASRTAHSYSIGYEWSAMRNQSLSFFLTNSQYSQIDLASRSWNELTVHFDYRLKF